jgi:hypothetical protein
MPFTEAFHPKNWFTQYETGSNKVKLPKVGLKAMVPVPVGAGPNKRAKHLP